MVKNNEFNWRDLRAGKEIATFKKTNTLILTFKSDGIIQDNTFELQDGSIKNIKQVHFEVVDYTDNKEKDFNASSKRLIETLSEFNPIVDETIKIDKVGFGFDTQYFAEKFKIPAKKAQ